VEICNFELGSGNMCKGMLVEVIPDPLHERSSQEKKDEAESGERNIRSSFEFPHV
jgi:hypothetical protein